MSRKQEVVLSIPVDRIRPGSTQTRRRFDPEALAELAESIRESGVVQPVVLRSVGRGYELLAGERRWRAAQQAGLHEIPALVRDDLSDAEAFVLGLIENLQRESLSPIETADGLRRLSETFGLRHEDVGTRIGKSRSYVTNHLRLLALAPPVQGLVDEGRLSLGHAKVLAGLELSRQLEWANLILREGLSVRAFEQRLAGRKPRRAVRHDGDWQRLARTLSEQLGYPAEFKPGAKGAGELRLRFHSLEELDGLLARLGYREN
jgi:ParB family transcriptional regulator, chromosome partitioning protein